MESIGLMALEALFYGVMIAVGFFIISVIRKYNLQDEICTLVGAAEVLFQGTKLGEIRKEWVIGELKKKFPHFDEAKVDQLINYFVQALTK